MPTTMLQQRQGKIFITETKIIYGQTEYKSASQALDAYIRDHDALMSNSNYLSDRSVPSNEILQQTTDSAKCDDQLQDVKSALSDLHDVKDAINSSLEKMKSVDRMIEYAHALEESNKQLNNRDADLVSSHSISDIGSMATEALLDVNPYISSRQSRHVYSYRMPNSRSRSLSNSRKLGKAMVSDSVGKFHPRINGVSPDLLAKTAEVSTMARTELDAINSIDKRLSLLDDHLLSHQMKRSQSVPGRSDRGCADKAPSWVYELDGSTVSSYIEVNPTSDAIPSKKERKNMAQRWLAEIEAGQKVEPLSMSKTDMITTANIHAKKSTFSEFSKQKDFHKRGNLRPVFSENKQIDSTNSLASQYADLNNCAIEDQKRVDKMLDDLDKIKHSFEVTANNVENLQSPLKNLNQSLDERRMKVLSSTMNADDSDVNVIDDGEISSISQHAAAGRKLASSPSSLSFRGAVASCKKQDASKRNDENQKGDGCQSGSMETLKTMLFTLQAEASAVNEQGSPALPSSDANHFSNTETEKCGGEIGSDPVLLSLSDYNFEKEPGGHSLHKALSHLSRLKSLVDQKTPKV